MKKIIQITFLLISLLIGGYWIVSEMTEKNNIEYILKEQGIFGKAFFYNLKDEVPEEALKTEVYQHAENVKGEMQIVLDDSEEFPEGLIWQIEEALYDSFTHVNENYSTDGNKNKQYFGLLSKLGGEHFLLKLDDMYKLFPKLQENEIELNDIYEAYHLVYGTESCLAMFRYTSTEQEDVYVTVVDNGGSNGSATVYINNLIDGNFVVRYMFEVQNFGNGCVIQYEEEFYYIYLHYNYNLKNYDGVQILKLGEKELE